MLGLDMDIEAELGIDSIKRVEILSALEEKMSDLPAVSPDMMGTLKTLGQIADYLAKPTAENKTVDPAGESQPKVLSAMADHQPQAPTKLSRTVAEPDMVPVPPRQVVTVVEAPPPAETSVTLAGNKKVLVIHARHCLSHVLRKKSPRSWLNLISKRLKPRWTY